MSVVQPVRREPWNEHTYPGANDLLHRLGGSTEAVRIVSALLRGLTTDLRPENLSRYDEEDLQHVRCMGSQRVARVMALREEDR